MADTSMQFVYFLISLRKNKCYVGSTSKDPLIRLREHNTGSNAWTSANRPFKFVYYESYECLEDATKRELFYKTGVGKRIKGAIVAEMTKEYT